MTGEIPMRVAERAATHFQVEGDCWISTYSRGSHGYAQVGWHTAGEVRQATTAHRAAYTFHTGLQIPEGMTVDHTCHNRPCVRIDHLRLLSNVANAQRNSSTRDFPLEWQCRHGHPPSDRVQVQRRTKAGQPRLGWTCRKCVADSRRRWAENHPEQYRENIRKSNAKRASRTVKPRG